MINSILSGSAIIIVVGIFFITCLIENIRKRNYKEALKIKTEKINDWQHQIGKRYSEAISSSVMVCLCSNTVCKNAKLKPDEYVYKYFYKDKSDKEKAIIRFFIQNKNDVNAELYKEAISLRSQDKYELDMTNLDNGLSLSKYVSTSWEIPSLPKVSFIFRYVSPQGKSINETIIPVSQEILDYINKKEEWLNSAKGQRSLMTSKLRKEILQRDNYTCKICGNSIKKEPNLLLEVDHIIPVSKGGKTTKENLQTLCWKCNRSKSNKI